MASGSVGSAKIDLTLDAKKAIKGLADIRKQTAATTREMAASFDRVKSKFDGIARAGKVAFVAIGGAMTGASIAAAKFEKEMANVSTMLTGMDNNLLPSLSKGVLDMSMEFGEGTATLSKGLYDILSAGIDAADSMEVLRVSAQAATAGMTDTGVAADAITTILNSYQLSADQAEAVSDKLFATVKRGKTTFDQLAPAIGLVASTASQAGLSFDEVSGAIATATRNGVRTEIAVTGVNAVLQTFLKASDGAKEAAAKFGIELNAETLKTEGLSGVLKKLQGARAEEVAAIFENVRALKVIMPLLGDLDGLYSDIALSANSAGLSQEAFAKISDTLSKNFDRLKQTFMALLITVGQMINDFIAATGILDTLQGAVKGLIDYFNSFEPSTRRLIAAVGALALGLSALAIVVGTVAGAIAALATGPVLAVVGAIVGAGGLVGAAVLLSSSFEDVAADAEHYGQQLEKLKEQTIEDIKAHQTQEERLGRLSKRYQELDKEILDGMRNGERRAEAEEELKKISKEIADIVPQATIAWNDYGEAIDVDINKVQQFSAEQKELFEQTMRLRQAEYDLLIAEGKAKEEEWKKERTRAKERIREISEEQAKLREAINARKESASPFDREAQGSIEFMERAIQKLDQEAKTLNVTVAETSKGLQELKVNEQLREEIQGIIDGTIDIADASNEVAEALEKIGGEEATANVRTLAEAYDLVNKAVAELPTPLQQAEEGFKKAYDTAVKLAEEGKEGTKEFSQALDEMSSAVDELSSQLDTYYNDLRENSGWSTDAVIADIERRMAAERAAHGEASALYVSLGQKLVTEQEKANSAYVKIWDDTVSSINRGMEDMISEIIKGNKSIGDAFKDLGKVIIDSFIEAFAKSIVEKLAFDSLFSSNIFNLGGLFSSVFASAAADASASIASVGAASTAATTGAMAAAGETGALAGTGLYTSGIATPGVSFAAGPPAWFTGTTAEWTASMGELSAAQTQVIANQGVLGGLFSDFGSTIAGTAGPIVVVTAAVDGMIQGTEEFNKALDDGIDSWEGLGHAATGAGTIVNPVGARIAASLNNATLEAVGLNEGLANVGSRMAEFAVMGSVIPVIGTGIGAVVGGLAGLAENMGLIKHGTTGVQDLVGKLQAVVAGYSTIGEVIGMMRQYTTGSRGLMSTVDTSASSSVQEDWISLEDTYEKRQKWFDKYVEQTGLFKEDELNEVRDMLQLWETEEEIAAGNRREALRTASQDMAQYVWDMGEEFRQASAGWSDAFDEAWAQAAEGSVTFADAFRANLEAIPGMTEETIEQLMKLFGKAGDHFEELGKTVSENFSSGLEGGEEGEVKKLGLLFPDDSLIDAYTEAGAEAGAGFEAGLAGHSPEGKGKEGEEDTEAKPIMPGYAGILAPQETLDEIVSSWTQTGVLSGDGYATMFEEGSLEGDELKGLLASDEVTSEIVNLWEECGLSSSEEYSWAFEDGVLTEDELEELLADEGFLNDLAEQWGEAGEEAATSYSENFNNNIDIEDPTPGEGGGGGGGGNGNPYPPGSSAWTLWNQVHGYARGTNFYPGGWGMVGEQGPELVKLPRGSQIFPYGTGPGGIVFNRGAIRINTGDIRTAADERDLARRLTKTITRAVESSMARV